MRHGLFLLLVLVCAPARSAEPLKRHNSRPLQAETDVSALETWETPITAFFVRSHHEVPIVDPDSYELVIDGLVEKPLKLSLKELQRLPEKSLHAVLECSGNGRAQHKPKPGGVPWEKGAVGNAEWTGTSLADLLAKARPKPEARFARVEGADKPAMPGVPPFVRSVPIAKLRDAGTLLAWKMNREPMPLLHGGPLRLILPNWYGQNWIKWVTHITLSAEEDQGFYMKKAYRMPGGTTPEALLVQSIIVSPRNEDLVAIGDIALGGKAFSGSGTITQVEYSIDNAKTWKPATVEAPHADGGWQEFKATIAVKKPGTLTVLTRATDSAGNRQPIEPVYNPGGYLKNWVDRVSVKVVKQRPAVADASAVQDKCLTCHTMEMIAIQRLSPEAWEKTVAKMETFGVKLTPDERRAVLKYVTQFSPDLPPASPARTTYASESALVAHESGEASPSRGEKLYAANCASCHGAEAEGKQGPRLRGRVVTDANFWSSVVYGRNSMPAFGETLTRSQVADLRSFLNRPM